MAYTKQITNAKKWKSVSYQYQKATQGMKGKKVFPYMLFIV